MCIIVVVCTGSHIYNSCNYNISCMPCDERTPLACMAVPALVSFTTLVHACTCTCVCVVSPHYCKDAVGSLHWPGHIKQTLQIDQFPNTLSLCLWQHTQVTLLLSYSSKSMLYAWHKYMHTLFYASVGLPQLVPIMLPCYSPVGYNTLHL